MTDFLLMIGGALFAMVISGIVNYKKSAWVGLTDEEIKTCNQTTTDKGTPCIWIWGDDFEESGVPFARAIEAKLKEKNT